MENIYTIHFLYLLVSLTSSLAGAHESSPEFPCDLHNRPFLPEIVIYGESHTNQQDMARKELLLREALKGERYLALEGVVQGAERITFGEDIQSLRRLDRKFLPSKIRVFGLEEELPLAAAPAALVYRAAIDGSSESLRSAVVGLATSIAVHPHIRAMASNELKIDPAQVEKAARFDQFVAYLIEEPRYERRQREVMRFASTALSGDAPFFRYFSRALLERILIEGTKVYPYGSRLQSMAHDILQTLAKMGDSAEESRTLLELVAIQWRHVAYIAAIGKLYCSMLPTYHPLEIVVGRSHVEDLVTQITWASGALIVPKIY